jgi:hypothetical protein
MAYAGRFLAMASTEKPADPSAVAKLSLGLLLAIGLMRTVALALTNGVAFLGAFTLAGARGRSR